MQVILLEKIVNLGQLGDVVKVKEATHATFLIPQGKGASRHRDRDQGIRSASR